MKSAKKDLARIYTLLTSSQVFEIIPGRQHRAFRNLKTNLIRTIKKKELTEWISDNFYPLQYESNI